MELSDLTIKLIILFVPGAIAALMLDKLTVHEKWSSFYFIVYSVILGFCSYLLLQLLYFCYNFVIFIGFGYFYLTKLNFWLSLLDKDTTVSYIEVLSSCAIGCLFGFAFAAVINHKWLTRIAKAYDISYKFGDENLYSYFLNSKEVNVVWIRDKNRGFTYEGYISHFSENNSIREIVLKDVKVFTYEDSKFCYEIPAIYLSFTTSQVYIEAPILD